MNKKPTGEQPKKGEVVMTCGHDTLRSKWYGFKRKNGPALYESSAGQKCESQWLICCRVCFKRIKRDPSKLTVAAAVIWGEKPSDTQN